MLCGLVASLTSAVSPCHACVVVPRVVFGWGGRHLKRGRRHQVSSMGGEKQMFRCANYVKLTKQFIQAIIARPRQGLSCEGIDISKGRVFSKQVGFVQVVTARGVVTIVREVYKLSLRLRSIPAWMARTFTSTVHE